MASALRATACFLETLELLPDVPTVRDCQRDADELANIVDSLCDEVAADERHPLNRFGDGVDGGRGYSADAGWGGDVLNSQGLERPRPPRSMGARGRTGH